MEKINLSEAEKAELKRLHKSLKDGKSRDKLKAILMLDSGYTSIEIAEVLLLDDNTITEWKKKYLERENTTKWTTPVKASQLQSNRGIKPKRLLFISHHEHRRIRLLRGRYGHFIYQNAPYTNGSINRGSLKMDSRFSETL